MIHTVCTTNVDTCHSLSFNLRLNFFFPTFVDDGFSRSADVGMPRVRDARRGTTSARRGATVSRVSTLRGRGRRSVGRARTKTKGGCGARPRRAAHGSLADYCARRIRSDFRGDVTSTYAALPRLSAPTSLVPPLSLSRSLPRPLLTARGVPAVRRFHSRRDAAGRAISTARSRQKRSPSVKVAIVLTYVNYARASRAHAHRLIVPLSPLVPPWATTCPPALFLPLGAPWHPLPPPPPRYRYHNNSIGGEITIPAAYFTMTLGYGASRLAAAADSDSHADGKLGLLARPVRRVTRRGFCQRNFAVAHSAINISRGSSPTTCSIPRGGAQPRRPRAGPARGGAPSYGRVYKQTPGPGRRCFDRHGRVAGGVSIGTFSPYRISVDTSMNFVINYFCSLKRRALPHQPRSYARFDSNGLQFTLRNPFKY